MSAAALLMPEDTTKPGTTNPGNTNNDDFQLSNDADSGVDAFELEALQPSPEPEGVQGELYLPESNPEQPEAGPQIELDGMAKPVFAVQVSRAGNDAVQSVSFQHATTLLDSLEAQNVTVHYQCREGYCGSCRVQLLDGEVHYNEEPMAWINDDEILPCCCIPKTDLKIKID